MNTTMKLNVLRHAILFCIWHKTNFYYLSCILLLIKKKKTANSIYSTSLPFHEQALGNSFITRYLHILSLFHFESMATLLPSLSKADLIQASLIGLTALPGLFMMNSKCQSWTFKVFWLSTHIKGVHSHLSQFSIPREKNHIHLSVIYSNVKRYFFKLNIRTNHCLSSQSFYTGLEKDHTS